MSAGLCVVQAVVCVVVEQKCFGCIDGRVQLRAGVQVLSVQVHTPGISPAKKSYHYQKIKNNIDKIYCGWWDSRSPAMHFSNEVGLGNQWHFVLIF